MTEKSPLAHDWRYGASGALRLAAFLLLCGIMFFPLLIAFYRNKGDPHKLPLILHKGIVKILKIKLRLHGEHTPNRPTLFVANHASYLDVPVLGSVIPAAFVAKHEVGTWPLIGPMAKLQRTVFVIRRSIKAAEQTSVLRQRLMEGQNLIVFPEGTSSDGHGVLPFKSSLFNVVEEPLPNGMPIMVQPVSVVCTEILGMPIGRAWRPYYAWFGDMTLVPHLWRAFCLGHFTVDVIFHPAVSPSAFANRKALSQHCQDVVAKGVELCVTGRQNKESIIPTVSVPLAASNGVAELPKNEILQKLPASAAFNATEHKQL